MQALPVTQPTTDNDFIILKFADSAVPVFKEQKNKDYIAYGEDNMYPDYLTYQPAYISPSLSTKLCRLFVRLTFQSL